MITITVKVDDNEISRNFTNEVTDSKLEVEFNEMVNILRHSCEKCGEETDYQLCKNCQ